MLPTSILVTCSVDGSNQIVPASIGAEVRAFKGPDQPMNRIIGAMRVSDVTLRAMHLDLHVNAAAPADFDHIAQPHRTGRFPDQAKIGHVIVRPHPLQHLDSAIGRRAFLVARDQKADRTVLARLALDAARRLTQTPR